MAENPSNDDLESSDDEIVPPSPSSFGSYEDENETSSVHLQTSMALEAARIWVEKHQEASMIGAFAVGVFLGGLLRD